MTESAEGEFEEAPPAASEPAPASTPAALPPEPAAPPAAGPPEVADYELIEKVGPGVAAEVFKARHRSTDRVVALKFVRDDLVKDEEARERFLREGRLLAGLDDPHLVKVHAVGKEGDRFFRALEYLPGADVERLLAKSRGKLPEPRALEIVRDAARGLVALAKAGLVHRAIEPANVFVGEGGAKLSDPALSRRAADGTPAFLAPEQAKGEAVDGRADVYALGALLYRLVAGKPPFAKETPEATLASVIADPVPDPLAANPALTDGTVRLIQRAMAKDPARRFRGAAEFLAACEGARSGAAGATTKSEKPGARPDTRTFGVVRAPEKPPEASRSAPVLVAILGVVAVGAIAFEARKRHASPEDDGVTAVVGADSRRAPMLPLTPLSPRVAADAPPAIVKALGRNDVAVRGTGAWSRAALVNDHDRTLPLRVRWRCHRLRLEHDGRDPARESEIGMTRGASYCYELGFDAGKGEAQAASELVNAVWLTVALRTDGVHSLSLRARSTDGPRARTDVLAAFDLEWPVSGSLEVTLEVARRGWNLVVQPERGEPVKSGDAWQADLAPLVERFAAGGRVWTQLGSWGGEGLGEGAVGVYTDR